MDLLRTLSDKLKPGDYPVFFINKPHDSVLENYIVFNYATYLDNYSNDKAEVEMITWTYMLILKNDGEMYEKIRKARKLAKNLGATKNFHYYDKDLDAYLISYEPKELKYCGDDVNG